MRCNYTEVLAGHATIENIGCVFEGWTIACVAATSKDDLLISRVDFPDHSLGWERAVTEGGRINIHEPLEQAIILLPIRLGNNTAVLIPSLSDIVECLDHLLLSRIMVKRLVRFGSFTVPIVFGNGLHLTRSIPSRRRALSADPQSRYFPVL